MKNFCVLIDALNYIDNNITEDINPDSLAVSCFMSVSGLHKLFRYALNISVADYITRRRMSKAACDLLETNRSILDIAVDYQYNSNEAFTRAFIKIWGIPPSQFRTERRFTEIFPKIDLNVTGGKLMTRRKFDLSKLYDEIRNMNDTYALSFDMVGLDAINNNYGSLAGDKAIAESFKRIDECANGNMLLFRIGGDEFVLLTGYENRTDAEELAKNVLSKNSQPIIYEDKEIPISLWVGGMKLKSYSLRYAELYPALMNTVNQSKENGNSICIID